ncbi:MAG: motility protein A [Eubacteriales bacterium]
MDFTSIIGLVLGLGFIAYGYYIDGGDIAALYLTSAIFITLGGTIGAIVMSYSFKQLKKLPGLFLESIISPKSNLRKTIDYLVSLSENARKDGLLSLENIINDEKAKTKIDPFLKRGILMVVDGTDPEEISDTLQNFIYVYEQDKTLSISMIEGAAGYAPAFGMVGTIIGLIQVLAADMSSPEQLTKAIGVAFITTLYGVIVANLICMPIATKLKNRLILYRMEKELIIEGVCAIRNGINSRILREKLASYLQLEGKNAEKAASAAKAKR